MTPAYVILAIGVVLHAIGVIVWMQRRAFLGRAVRTMGVVVANEAQQRRRQGRQRQGQWRTVYLPRVRFDAGGRTMEIVGGVGGSRPRYAVGTQLEVLYDPHKPEDASISTTLELYGAVIAVGMVGLLLELVAAVLIATRAGGMQ